MKPISQVVVTGALVCGAGIAACMFLPRLQAPATIVGRQAEESSERARRLLDQYDPVADVTSRTLAQAGSSDDLTDERISQLVEDDSRQAQDVLDQEAQRINDMLKSAVGRLREHDRTFDELGGETSGQPWRSVDFGNNPNAMTRSMSEGLKSSAVSTKRNRAILKRATDAVSAGLRASSGDSSGNDSLIANRMNGVALYHRGLAMDRRAHTARTEAESILANLSQLQIHLSSLKQEAGVVRSSGIGDAISKQRTRLSEAESAHKAILQSVADLDRKIETAKGKIDEQSELAAGLRDRLDALEARGVQYEKKNAGDEFAREYASLSAKYRAALRQEQELRQGTIKGARLEAGGDFVSGRYVPDREGADIRYELGLDELERRLVQVGWEQVGAKQIFDDESAGLRRLTHLKESYVSKAEAANNAMQAGIDQGKKLLESYRAVATEVASLGDESVDMFKSAKRAFSAARRAAQARISDLPQLTAEKEERSPGKLIKTDRWLVGQMASQAADSGTRASMLLFDRYTHLSRAIAILESLESTLTTADLQTGDLKTMRTAAKEDAESLLDDAIDAFEGSGRDFDQHWSVAASVAAADYMLALFDHPELVGAAIANYQSVVKDRETEPHIRPFAERLEQLRKR